VVEFAVNMCEDKLITVRHLPKWLTDKTGSEEITDATLEQIVQEAELRAITNMMKIYGTSLEAKRIIAKKLDISLASLYNKIKL
jgi:transcriptional regulator with PAS, ATPase and Fis domain